MASADSHPEGCKLPTDGRQVKTGAAGGGCLNKQKRTERRKKGDRERMRENFTGGQGTQVNLGGDRGGDQNHILRTGKEIA